jgi:hypothetical protein
LSSVVAPPWISGHVYKLEPPTYQNLWGDPQKKKKKKGAKIAPRRTVKDSARVTGSRADTGVGCY